MISISPFILLLAAGYFIIFIIVMKAIGKLSPEISPYFDFGKRFPGSGRLVIFLYLLFLVIFVVALLVLARTKLTIPQA